MEIKAGLIYQIHVSTCKLVTKTPITVNEPN